MISESSQPGGGPGGGLSAGSAGQPPAAGVTAEWRSWPATAAAVRLARRSAVAFAESAGASRDLLQRVGLAVSEAVTNVVLHAYQECAATAGREGSVHVGSAVAGEGGHDELWILVADDGSGLRPRGDSPGGGHGLSLIARVADELTIVPRGGGGTELRMRFDLTTPGGD